MRTKTDGNPYLTLDHIRAIIVNELELEPDRVNIYNQKFKIPTDDGLFIVVGYKGSPKIVSNRNTQVTVASVYTEVMDVNTQELISIGIFSRSLEAIRRKEEVLMALRSLYAQSVQEANSFRIHGMSAIEDLSDLEGSAQLYRFDLSVICFAWYRKTKTADFYNAFNVELSTEQDSRIPIRIENPERILTEDGEEILDEAGVPLSTE